MDIRQSLAGNQQISESNSQLLGMKYLPFKKFSFESSLTPERTQFLLSTAFKENFRHTKFDTPTTDTSDRKRPVTRFSATTYLLGFTFAQLSFAPILLGKIYPSGTKGVTQIEYIVRLPLLSMSLGCFFYILGILCFIISVGRDDIGGIIVCLLFFPFTYLVTMKKFKSDCKAFLKASLSISEIQML